MTNDYARQYWREQKAKQRSTHRFSGKTSEQMKQEFEQLKATIENEKIEMMAYLNAKWNKQVSKWEHQLHTAQLAIKAAEAWETDNPPPKIKEEIMADNKAYMMGVYGTETPEWPPKV